MIEPTVSSGLNYVLSRLNQYGKKVFTSGKYRRDACLDHDADVVRQRHS